MFTFWGWAGELSWHCGRATPNISSNLAFKHGRPNRKYETKKSNILAFPWIFAKNWNFPMQKSYKWRKWEDNFGTNQWQTSITALLHCFFYSIYCNDFINYLDWNFIWDKSKFSGFCHGILESRSWFASFPIWSQYSGIFISILMDHSHCHYDKFSGSQTGLV